MPRKLEDPFIKVQRYFETAPIDAASLAVSVVAEIVRRRKGDKGESTPPKPRVRKSTTAPGYVVEPGQQ